MKLKQQFGLRAALACLVLIAIAPAFGVVVQASLAEQQGRIEGALAGLRAVVDLSTVQPERLRAAGLTDADLRKLKLPAEVSLMVIDSRAKVRATAGPHVAPAGSDLPAGFLRDAISAGVPVSLNAPGLDRQNTLFAIQPFGPSGEQQLFMAGSIASADVLAPSARSLYMQLLALGFITLLGAVAAWIVGDRVVVRPVERLLRRIEALGREQLEIDATQKQTGPLELRELDRRFLEMAKGLSDRSAQRDRALAEMAAQKSLLESILESMAEGVLVLDRSGHHIHSNRAAHRIMPGATDLNLNHDPMHVSADQWGLFHPDGLTPLQPEERPSTRAFNGENLENFRYIIRGTLSGGAEKVLQAHTRSLLTPQAERYGAVLVFADITAAYRAEQALRDSEQRYRALFKSNPHPMWVYDLDTLEFLTVNDAAVAHYGYTREEFIGMTVTQIRPEEDVSPLVEAIGRNLERHSPEMRRHTNKSGQVIWVETSGHSLTYAGRRARMVLALDITERRRAKQALEHLNETLERRVTERTHELALANRELESFAYSVSHDLRAPLQAIDGFGQALLSRHAQQLDLRGRHYLERIRDNTRKMGELIDDLLLLARVTRSEIKSERVNLASVSAQIVERLQQLEPKREVKVHIDSDMTCAGDPRLLAIALENLIENAWKFTSRTAAPCIRIGRRPGTGEQADGVYVSDNGAGFDMAYSDKLFQEFQRLHTTSEFEGTGIGLATVHRIVSRHGGKVWAQGVPGRGATFHFTLGANATQESPP